MKDNLSLGADALKTCRLSADSPVKNSESKPYRAGVSTQPSDPWAQTIICYQSTSPNTTITLGPGPAVANRVIKSGISTVPVGWTRVSDFDLYVAATGTVTVCNAAFALCHGTQPISPNPFLAWDSGFPQDRGTDCHGVLAIGHTTYAAPGVKVVTMRSTGYTWRSAAQDLILYCSIDASGSMTLAPTFVCALNYAGMATEVINDSNSTGILSVSPSTSPWDVRFDNTSIGVNVLSPNPVPVSFSGTVATTISGPSPLPVIVSGSSGPATEVTITGISVADQLTPLWTSEVKPVPAAVYTPFSDSRSAMMHILQVGKKDNPSLTLEKVRTQRGEDHIPEFRCKAFFRTGWSQGRTAVSGWHPTASEAEEEACSLWLMKFNPNHQPKCAPEVKEIRRLLLLSGNVEMNPGPGAYNPETGLWCAEAADLWDKLSTGWSTSPDTTNPTDDYEVLASGLSQKADLFSVAPPRVVKWMDISRGDSPEKKKIPVPTGGNGRTRPNLARAPEEHSSEERDMVQQRAQVLARLKKKMSDARDLIFWSAMNNPDAYMVRELRKGTHLQPRASVPNEQAMSDYFCSDSHQRDKILVSVLSRFLDTPTAPPASPAVGQPRSPVTTAAAVAKTPVLPFSGTKAFSTACPFPPELGGATNHSLLVQAGIEPNPGPFSLTGNWWNEEPTTTSILNNALIGGITVGTGLAVTSLNSAAISAIDQYFGSGGGVRANATPALPGGSTDSVVAGAVVSSAPIGSSIGGVSGSDGGAPAGRAALAGPGGPGPIVGEGSTRSDTMPLGYAFVLQRNPTVTGASGRGRPAGVGESHSGENFGFGADGHSETLALSRNRQMHALNGNTMLRGAFNQNMMEVENQSLLGSDFNQYIDVQSGVVANPLYLLQVKTGVEASRNPATQNLAAQNFLSATTATAAAAITTPATINTPEAILFPRTVRNGPAAGPVNSAALLPVCGFGLVQNDGGLNLQETALWLSLVKAQQEKMLIATNRNTLTIGGFFPTDVMSVASVATSTALVMDQMVLKLMYYLYTCAWLLTGPSVPLAGEPGKLDSFTKVQANALQTLEWNTSPVNGEDLNLDVLPAMDPVLPIVSPNNNKGILRFHLSLETVPAGRRSQAWFLPSAVFENSPSAQEAIALFVLSITVYPACLPVVKVPTLDTADGNPVDQVFIPFSGCASIPGSTELDIILPCVAAGIGLGNQNSVNAGVRRRPTFGPTATVGHVAFDPIDLCFVGTVREYGIADYAYSWLNGLASSTISQYLYTLNLLVPIMKTITMAQHVVSLTSCRYPALLVGDGSGANVTVLPNSDEAYEHSFAMHLSNPSSYGPFPLATSPVSDIYVNETLPTAWNQVGIGLKATVSTEGMGAQLPQEFNQGSLWASAQDLTRTYAAASQVFYSNLGFDLNLWDSAATANNYLAAQQVRAALFISTDFQSSAIASALGYTFAGLYREMFGFSVAQWYGGLNIWHLCAPIRRPRLLAYDPARDVWIKHMTPAVLPDVWLQLYPLKLPRWMGSFPPPGAYTGALTGLSGPGFQNLASTTGAFFPFQPAFNTVFALETTAMHSFNDAAMWNRRVTWHMDGMGNGVFWGNYAGVDLTAGATAVPTARTLIQRPVQPDTTLNPLTRPLTVNTMWSACTTWLPTTTLNGVVTWPLIPVAQSSRVSQVMVGASVASIASWVLRHIVINGNTPRTGGLPGTLLNSFKMARPAGSGGERKDPLKESGAQPDSAGGSAST